MEAVVRWGALPERNPSSSSSSSAQVRAELLERIGRRRVGGGVEGGDRGLLGPGVVLVEVLQGPNSIEEKVSMSSGLSLSGLKK